METTHECLIDKTDFMKAYGETWSSTGMINEEDMKEFDINKCLNHDDNLKLL